MSDKETQNETQQAEEETTAPETQDQEVTEESTSATETTSVDEGEEQSSSEPEKSPQDKFREENEFAKDWSDDEIRSWQDVAGDVKKAFVNGTDVLAYDPRREQRKPNQWSTEEIEQFLAGKLLKVKDHRRNELISEYKRRVSVDPAWSDQDLLHYIRSGEEPAKTPSGVWYRDVTRDKRGPSSWTDEELRAWAFGEIHSKVSSQKLINELNLRFDLTIPNNITDMKRVKKMVEEDTKRIETNQETKAQGELSKMNVSHIDTVLDKYVQAVKPGQEITTATATRAQNSLESLFMYVIKLEGRAMADGLDKIRETVKKHRNDVFHPDNAHRFTHLLKGDSSVKQRHIGLVELFVVVTDPNKARRKQTDFKALLRHFPNDKMEKLVDYFTNYT